MLAKISAPQANITDIKAEIGLLLAGDGEMAAVP